MNVQKKKKRIRNIENFEIQKTKTKNIMKITMIMTTRRLHTITPGARCQSGIQARDIPQGTREGV